VSKKWDLRERERERKRERTTLRGMKEVKGNKKVLYHFAIFAIVNELLIIKNCCTDPV